MKVKTKNGITLTCKICDGTEWNKSKLFVDESKDCALRAGTYQGYTCECCNNTLFFKTNEMV